MTLVACDLTKKLKNPKYNVVKETIEERNSIVFSSSELKGLSLFWKYSEIERISKASKAFKELFEIRNTVIKIKRILRNIKINSL